MNKRYMDFVPKGKKIPAKKPVEVKKSVPVKEEIVFAKEEEFVVETPVESVKENDDVEEISLDDFFAVDNAPRRRQKEPDFGIIEDYNPQFKKTEISKRPLGHPDAKFAPRPKTEAEKPAETKPEPKPKAQTSPVMKVPKFVNTEKVEKRPLSKNVYKKKIVAPKEEPSGPVTIIAKPDKGSHIGVIITIILTIILGAAAGTVAFLLLPK